MKRQHDPGILQGSAALNKINDGGVLSTKGGIVPTPETFRITRQGYLSSENKPSVIRKGYVSEPDITSCDEGLMRAKRKVQPPVLRESVAKKKSPLSPSVHSTIKYITSPECFPPETPPTCRKSRIFSPTTTVAVANGSLTIKTRESKTIPSKRRVEIPTSPDPVTGKKIVTSLTNMETSGREEYRINVLEGRSPLIDRTLIDPMSQLTPQRTISVGVLWPNKELQNLRLCINRCPVSMRELKAALHGFLVNEYALKKKAERGINLLDRIDVTDIINKLSLGDVLTCYGQPANWKKLTSLSQAFPPPDKQQPVHGYEFFVTTKTSRSGHHSRLRMPRISRSLADCTRNIMRASKVDKSVNEIIDKSHEVWETFDETTKPRNFDVEHLNTIPILPSRYLSEVIDPNTSVSSREDDVPSPLRLWHKYKKDNYNVNPTTSIPEEFLSSVSMSTVLALLNHIKEEENRVTRKLGVINSQLLSDTIGSSTTNRRKKSMEHYIYCLRFAVSELQVIVSAHSSPMG